MTYREAYTKCHARSAIYRTSQPATKFWKNHSKALDDRVPDDWKVATDWAEYDPADADHNARDW